VTTAVGADEMIDRVGEPNVFAHLDTFHMNVEEKGFRDPVVVPRGEAALRPPLGVGPRHPGNRERTLGRALRRARRDRFDGRLVLESYTPTRT